MKLEVKREPKEDIFGKRKYRYVWGVILIEFAIIIGIILRYGPASEQIISKNLIMFFIYAVSAYPLFNVINKLVKVINNKIPADFVAKGLDKLIEKGK